jgi:hypothetical protein
MARPVKWSRDLHPIRERASRSSTETWSRQDIEHLFEIGRVSAQNLMKAIGEVQSIGGTHFIDRTSLLGFLNEMAAADSLDDALRSRLDKATPISRPAKLRQSLPEGLRNAMLVSLPSNVSLSTGEVRITGKDAEEVVSGLLHLARVMQDDLPAVRLALDPPREPPQVDDELRKFFEGLRRPAAPISSV